MKNFKVAILTSSNQWFIPYAKELQKNIKNCSLYFSHLDIQESYDIVFILSYHFIIPEIFLQKHKYNCVIHASNLPCGKGWAPLFWQVLEGKNSIVFTMFEANAKTDNGEIYFQEILELNGLELYDELRDKQAKMCQKMCLDFLNKYPNIIKTKQIGSESFYPKRNAKDSELDIHKSINEQFNLLRITSNDDFPAFFYKDNQKFIIKIYKDY